MKTLITLVLSMFVTSALAETVGGSYIPAYKISGTIGLSQLATTGNYTTSGTITGTNFQLSVVRWKDSAFTFSYKVGGVGSPALTAFAAPFGGLKDLGFADNESVNGQCQINHDIAASNVNLYTELHGHVFPLVAPPPGANLTKLQFVYAAANIGNALNGPWTNTIQFALGTNRHELVESGHLWATNFYPSLSAMYLTTITRLAADSNNYTGAITINADVHYPVDRFGSVDDVLP